MSEESPGAFDTSSETQRGLIDGAVGLERCNDCGTASTQLHWNSLGELQLAENVFKFVKTLLAGDPLGGAVQFAAVKTSAPAIAMRITRCIISSLLVRCRSVRRLRSR